MADSDASSPILRYNLVSNVVEYFNGADYYPTLHGSGGITTLTGDVTAGPGSGSVSATVVSAGGGTGAFSAGQLSASGLIGTAQPFIFKPSVDSTTAMEWTTASGVVLLKWDSANGFLGINTGSATPSRNLEVFGNANVTADFLAGTIHINDGFLYLEGIYTASQIIASSGTLGQLATASDTGAVYYYDGVLWKNLNPQTTTQTGTGTVTPVANAGSTLSFPVSGNLTINGPTGGYDGQKLTLRIVNDSSHSVTLATGSGNFEFGSTIPSYTNSTSKIDYVGVIYNSSASLWHVVGISQGF